ncbi:radical SAM protein [Plasmodium brasilianum]|uniref:Radical SAM protein n=1 Tax=Plasmodium brasilianum TaxID=5824 RepID=A0ACB9Y7U6_PLABR|nr:radical SAM protein [Plasmodium brasilianum]
MLKCILFLNNGKKDGSTERTLLVNNEKNDGKSTCSENVILNESTSIVSTDNESNFIGEHNIINDGKIVLKDLSGNSLDKNILHDDGLDNNDISTNKRCFSEDDGSTLTDVEDISNINDRRSFNVVQIKKKKKSMRNNCGNNGSNSGSNSSSSRRSNRKSGTNFRRHEKGEDSRENRCIVGKYDEEKEEEEYRERKKKKKKKQNYKIYFKSFGCAHNSSDSEFMMGLLSNYGFQFVKNIEDCNICIINSCTVKNPSEESMKTIINYVNKLNRLNSSDTNMGSVNKQKAHKKKQQGTQKGEQKGEQKEQKKKKKKIDELKYGSEGHLEYLSTSSSGLSDFPEFSNFLGVSNFDKISDDKKGESEKMRSTCGGEKNDGIYTEKINKEECLCTMKKEDTDKANDLICHDRGNKLFGKNEERKEDTNMCGISLLVEGEKENKLIDKRHTANKRNNNEIAQNCSPWRDIKIIVCGCVPQAEKDMEIFENISLVGVNNIDKIVDVVENVIKGYHVKYLKQSKKMTSLNLPKIRKNKYIEIININNGCLGNCTYCKTKFARGDLVSYNISDIVNRIKYVCSEENIKEIWLTSEDTGAYGIDLDLNIAILLKQILECVEHGDVMIRLGMTNPPYILKHVKDICNLLKHKNMYEFIHIPVQSASNNVLKNMNREYNIEDFIYVVENLRKHVPNITISTDIICGFPYETVDDHNETIHLIKKYKFPILNISQFYPRKGTVAYNMKKINTKIVKNRSREVTDVFLSYKNNYDFLQGTIQNVLFTELSSKSEHIIGHTKQYVKVLLSNKENQNIHLLGHFTSCKIVSTHKWHVVAQLV